MTKRAVIYARYSSELQSERSIEDQVALCRQKAEREGWEVTETFTDYALSGASLARPGLQALVEKARASAFDILLTESLDRLSRD
jgi:site-specific DNA recombinase